MKKLLLLLVIAGHTAFSETTRIDSLKLELKRINELSKGYTRDTLHYNTLKAIMRTYAEVRMDSSYHYNRLLIAFCAEKSLKKELVYSHSYTGILYQIQGRYYESIQSSNKTLKLAELYKQYGEMPMIYRLLADAYRSLNQYDLALERCRMGLEILNKYPDADQYEKKLAILNTQAIIFRRQGKFNEALATNNNMYQLARSKPKSLWYESQGLNNFGLIYKQMNNLGAALDYFERSLKLSQQAEGSLLEVNILANIADVYVRQKAWPQALNYCERARQMAQRMKNSDVVKEVQELLYKIYKQKGQPDKALSAYETFVQLKDSLSKEKTEQRIELLQAQYENVKMTNSLQEERVKRLEEQNQREQLAQRSRILYIGISVVFLFAILLFFNNKRLESKNREIGQQRALLEAARMKLADINVTLETRVEERTKELVIANRELTVKNEEIKQALFKGQSIERKRVAQDLHDNLSSLLSAVNMSVQSINYDNLPKSEQVVYKNIKHLIQNAYTEVRNISHNILPAHLDREGLVNTLRIMVDQLNESFPTQHFALSISGMDERLPVEIEFNMYSIVWELINNAIKHANASTIEIGLSRTPDGIDLLVRDDGVGLNPAQVKRGNGLLNIHTRLESLGGTFNSSFERGTLIYIKIPIETVCLNGNSIVA